MSTIQSTLIQLLQGFKFTFGIFFFTLIFSIPLGLLVSKGRMSKITIISLIFQLYISVLRGTPLMLQLLLVYFGPYYIFGVNLGFSGSISEASSLDRSTTGSSQPSLRSL